jgi:hypothetical protein
MNNRPKIAVMLAAKIAAVLIALHLLSQGETSDQSGSKAAREAATATSSLLKPATFATQVRSGQILPPVPNSAKIAAHKQPVAAPANGSAAAIAWVSPTELKDIRGNLGHLATAAEAYMLDKGVTEVSYHDLVGTGHDYDLDTITPVIGEDYSRFSMELGQSQVIMVAPDGTSIVYNL